MTPRPWLRPAFPGARWAMKPVCGQCRRRLDPTTDPAQPERFDAWQHEDGWPRCAQGTLDAVRGAMAALALAT